METKDVPGAVDLRQAILQRLQGMGKTPFWLSHEQKAAHPNTVQFFLYNGRSLRVPVVNALLTLTGLRVAPAEDTDRLAHLEEWFENYQTHATQIQRQAEERILFQRLETSARELARTQAAKQTARCRERISGTLKMLDKLRASWQDAGPSLAEDNAPAETAGKVLDHHRKVVLEVKTTPGEPRAKRGRPAKRSKTS